MNLHLPKHTAVSYPNSSKTGCKEARVTQGTVPTLHSHLGLSVISHCPSLPTRRNKGESQVPKGLGCPHRKLSSWLHLCCYYQSLHQQLRQETSTMLSPPILLQEQHLLTSEAGISIVSPDHGCAPRYWVLTCCIPSVPLQNRWSWALRRTVSCCSFF